MRSQSTSSGNTWPVEAVARNGVAVAGGYGVGISVWRGRLRVDDGIGENRRSRIYHRATSGLKRLVVLGHTGYVSLEGIRWLADVKAAYLQVDADGTSARQLRPTRHGSSFAPSCTGPRFAERPGNRALALVGRCQACGPDHEPSAVRWQDSCRRSSRCDRNEPTPIGRGMDG